ncbi:hypothetical protein [Aliikangiella sp. G2MR2-5]|uniref:hypothetical protein n=1 Tax=Aliikangiella sp. G2MR2-5 TaxID=2788943 RepID=UPI0018A955CF|nr:hypothetical protein [Aliikangiella sp. G2MR2-5]
MASDIPPFIQENGVPFDLFIQSLTDQLDRAQAAMALKSRVGKLPLTFAVKNIELDLKADIQMMDDEVYIQPARPGVSNASTIKLGLTTITKPMIEENAIDFEAEEPEVSLRDALGGDQESEDLQRRLEKIGVRSVNQLVELRKTAGSDVIARLARLPQNRMQRLLQVADAPKVDRVDYSGFQPDNFENPSQNKFDSVRPNGFEQDSHLQNGQYIQPGLRENLSPGKLPSGPSHPTRNLKDSLRTSNIDLQANSSRQNQSGASQQQLPTRLRVKTPLISHKRMPKVIADGRPVPIVKLKTGELLLEPLASQLGCEATLELVGGEKVNLTLVDGYDGTRHFVANGNPIKPDGASNDIHNAEESSK